MARFGFLGLGNMGLGLALNLAKRQGRVAGYALGYSPRMQDALRSRGIEWTPPDELAASSDILFTSLPVRKNPNPNSDTEQWLG